MAPVSVPFAVLLDLDGTLVDSVYHHVLAWDAALTAAGYRVPLWRIHHGVGLAGERLLPWLVGDQVPEADDIASGHAQRFLDMADRLRPTVGALELLDDLARREVTHIIATSSSPEENEVMFRALGREDLQAVGKEAVTSSKPAPDLLIAACEELGVEAHQAILIGDSPWDAEAADRLDMRTIAVRCGGFGEHVLREAGAYEVVDHPRELIGRL